MLQEPATAKMIQAYSAPVPRYTSYPTAPHFSAAVGAAEYRAWLGAIEPGSALSLYAHIPFCHSMCWYCGCNTKATARYEPVAGYLATLAKEVEVVGGLLPRAHRVSHVHWGGGSPNYLSGDDIEALAAGMRKAFAFDETTEFAVELDPRYLTSAQVKAFKASGVTRVSFGVQDFDETVQKAINRVQSFELTKRAIDLCREAGIASVNIDLIYGLPYQVRASISRTVEQVIALSPDRIAVFGYAHLPSRFKHQQLIPDQALPGPVERFGQASRAARMLVASGYVQIGLDHYAKVDDALGKSEVRRNFQGYTTDGSEILIGLGASAIGRLPQGYVQNAVARADYGRRIDDGGLATVRGKALSDEDRMRAHVIERLMCAFEFDRDDLRQRYGAAAAPLIDEAEELVAADRDGLLQPTDSGFRITRNGRPFTRTVCSTFDAYLGGGATHSSGV